MRVTIVAAVLLATATLSAQNWPMFRGPGASGVADGSPMPVTWNVKTGQNVLWKTPVAGVAVSSPIVWGDRIFVSTAVSSDATAGIRTGLYGDVEPAKDMSKHTWKLVALDKRTGKVQWERVAHEGIPKTKRHPKSSQATATPVTDGRRVIVSFGSEGLYAYDLDGKPLWQRDLGVLNAGWFYDPDYEWGIGSSPIIWKNLVIVQCDIQKNSFIAAFDVATGAPAVAHPPGGNSVLVDAGDFRARRPCRTRHAGDDVHPRVRSGERQGAVAALGQLRDHDPDADRRAGNDHRDQRLPRRATDLRDQARRDRRHHAERRSDPQSASIAWSTNRGGPYIPTPVIYGDTSTSCRINGVLAAYEVRTGQRVYQERVAGGGSFSASPVAADGKIYLTSEDGDVHVVKAGPTLRAAGHESRRAGDHGDAGHFRRNAHHSRTEGCHRDRN